MFLFRLKGDNQSELLLNDPIDWDEVKVERIRRKEYRGVITTIVSNVTFTGEAYDYLRTAFATSFCGSVDVTIWEVLDGVQSVFHEGIILLKDVAFNLKKQDAEVTIIDNSYNAWIVNNRELKAFVNVGRSKNDEVITAVTPDSLYMFNTTNGVYDGGAATRDAYRVYEVFEFLVAYMTDGRVGFASDFFSSNGKSEGSATAGGIFQLIDAGATFITDGVEPGDLAIKLMSGLNQTNATVISVDSETQLTLDITLFASIGDDYIVAPKGGIYFLMSGEAVGVNNSSPTAIPNVSFKQLFDEINKKRNIGIHLDDTGSGPVLRIEPIADLFKAEKSVELLDVAEVIQKITTVEMYASLNVGASETTTGNFTDIRFIGYTEEDYALSGVCNTSEVLNLVSDFFIDTNIIDAEVTAPTGTRDEDIFIVLGSNTHVKAIKTDIYGDQSVYVYNNLINNQNSVANWFDGIPGAISKYLGPAVDGTFRASKTPDQNVGAGSGTFQITFEDDTTAPNFDTDGNYNVATGDYTVPADGLYSFELNACVINSVQNGVKIYRFFIEHLDSGSALIEQSPGAGIAHTQGAFPFCITIYWRIYCRATDIIRCGLGVVNQTLAGDAIIQSGIDTTNFKCTNSFESGGVYQEAQATPKVHKFEVDQDYPLGRDNYNLIIADTRKKIGLTSAGYIIDGWVTELIYDPKRETADIVIISDNEPR